MDSNVHVVIPTKWNFILVNQATVKNDLNPSFQLGGK